MRTAVAVVRMVYGHPRVSDTQEHDCTHTRELAQGLATAVGY